VAVLRLLIMNEPRYPTGIKTKFLVTHFHSQAVWNHLQTQNILAPYNGATYAIHELFAISTKFLTALDSFFSLEMFLQVVQHNLSVTDYYACIMQNIMHATKTPSTSYYQTQPT